MVQGAGSRGAGADSSTRGNNGYVEKIMSFLYGGVQHVQGQSTRSPSNNNKTVKTKMYICVFCLPASEDDNSECARLFTGDGVGGRL
jgi:hypothetical protein